MSPREKVQNMLCDYGFAVALDDITFLQGWYRRIEADCADRWTATVMLDGKKVEVVGLNSLTECARHGIWLTNGGKKDTYGDYEAISKRNKKPANALELTGIK